MNELSQFYFLRPLWLLLAILPLLLMWYYHRLPVNKSQTASIAPHLYKALLVKQHRAHWLTPVPLALLALLLMTLALAGPSWQQQASPLSKDDSSLVIVLDNSMSMQQNDIPPSRWQRAIMKARDLVALRPAGKVGLVAFAGSAHWVLPPTSDMALVEYSLQGIERLQMPTPGKYWQRVANALAEFYPASDPSLSVLLITDTAPTEPLPAPWDKTYVASLLLSNDHSAALYKSVYYSPTNKDIERIAALITSSYNDFSGDNAQWLDSGYVLIYPMLILGLLWFRKGWSMMWSVLLCVTLLPAQPVYADDEGVTDWWFSGDQRGRWYFEKGDFNAAAKAFDDKQWRGISYYQSKQFEEAADVFATIDTPYARLMLANALTHMAEYQHALTIYNNLKSDGQFVSEVTNNIAFAEARLAEQIAMAASQQAGFDEQQSMQAIQLADGDQTEQGMASQLVEQLSAQDILTEQSIAERWMQHINTNLGDYLSNVFAQQQSEDAQP